MHGELSPDRRCALKVGETVNYGVQNGHEVDFETILSHFFFLHTIMCN